MGWFRSKEMKYVQITCHQSLVEKVVMQLGNKGVFQFLDSNKLLTAVQRSSRHSLFAHALTQIRRCDDMERIVRYLNSEMRRVIESNITSTAFMGACVLLVLSFFLREFFFVSFFFAAHLFIFSSLFFFPPTTTYFCFHLFSVLSLSSPLFPLSLLLLFSFSFSSPSPSPSLLLLFSFSFSSPSPSLLFQKTRTLTRRPSAQQWNQVVLKIFMKIPKELSRCCVKWPRPSINVPPI